MTKCGNVGFAGEQRRKRARIFSPFLRILREISPPDAERTSCKHFDSPSFFLVKLHIALISVPLFHRRRNSPLFRLPTWPILVACPPSRAPPVAVVPAYEFGLGSSSISNARRVALHDSTATPSGATASVAHTRTYKNANGEYVQKKPVVREI